MWYVKSEHEAQSYVAFVNKSRRTIEPGEQVFYQYGNRSNRFLLYGYGFCIPDNQYDSFLFSVRAEPDLISI